MALSHCQCNCRRRAQPLACLVQKDQAETGGLTLGTCRSASGASASSLLDAPAVLCTVSLRATPDSKAGALDARAAGGLCPVPENGTRFQQVRSSDCCCLMQHSIRPVWSLADLHGEPVQSCTPLMPKEACCSLFLEASWESCGCCRHLTCRKKVRLLWATLTATEDVTGGHAGV